MTILVVEDELIIAHSLKEMLLEMGFENVLIANTQSKAESTLLNQKVDLALLDINLGGGKEGIELSKITKKQGTPFLFVTSYTDKPTLDQALETTPAAYVNKPVQIHNLYTALRIALKDGAKTESQFIKFHEGTKVISIPSNELLFIHAENNYVKLVTPEKNYLIRMSLGKVLEHLNDFEFVQIHRSYVVNLHKVDSVETNHLTVGSHRLPISRSFKGHIKDKVMSY